MHSFRYLPVTRRHFLAKTRKYPNTMESWYYIVQLWNQLRHCNEIWFVCICGHWRSHIYKKKKSKFISYNFLQYGTWLFEWRIDRFSNVFPHFTRSLSLSMKFLRFLVGWIISSSLSLLSSSSPWISILLNLPE